MSSPGGPIAAYRRFWAPELIALGVAHILYYYGLRIPALDLFTADGRVRKP